MRRLALAFALLAALAGQVFASASGLAIARTYLTPCPSDSAIARILGDGYDGVILSPRQYTGCAGNDIVQKFLDRGMKVWLWEQPWLPIKSASDSTPYRATSFDDALWSYFYADSGVAALKAPTGANIYANVPPLNRGIDFSDTAFAHRWATWHFNFDKRLAGHGGWYGDYFDVGTGPWWVTNYDHYGSSQRAGYVAGMRWYGKWLKTMGMDAAGYFQPDFTSGQNIAILETIAYDLPITGGSSTWLYYYDYAMDYCLKAKRLGGKAMIWCLNDSTNLAAHRRALAAICLATDSYFMYQPYQRGSGWGENNLKAPEFFSTDLGAALDTAKAISDSVYMRRFQRGVVIVNARRRSTGSYTDSLFGTTTPRFDGTVLQTSFNTKARF